MQLGYAWTSHVIRYIDFVDTHLKNNQVKEIDGFRLYGEYWWMSHDVTFYAVLTSDVACIVS